MSATGWVRPLIRMAPLMKTTQRRSARSAGGVGLIKKQESGFEEEVGT